MPMRILLVDDHEVVRVGLRTLLSRHDEFRVVAEAATADEALEKTAQYRPDVVVMDIRLPGRNGIEATREIVEKYPETKVIVLTSYAEDDLLFKAINAGASGYVLKQIGSNDLIQALLRIGRGESLLDPALTQKLFQRVREVSRATSEQAFSDLTDQELRILAKVAEGKTNREIAKEVFLSEKTVRNYVSSILSKLSLSSRTEAAAYAIRHHIQDHLPTE
jgi:DNA-binding NarL/FixJ family response regulator